MLETQGISFAYPKGQALFKNLDLSFGPNERVALKAPSGFGKTTLCRILAGYLKPLQGNVSVDGKPLPRRRVSPVQLILQHPEKAVDPRLRMERTLEEAGPLNLKLLEQLDIKQEWLSRFPHELSGGELQRFCIARALGVSPKYLIADEISTMLDAVTQAQIWHFLLEETERQGIGLIFISHSLALTNRIATRVVNLSE